MARHSSFRWSSSESHSSQVDIENCTASELRLIGDFTSCSIVHQVEALASCFHDQVGTAVDFEISKSWQVQNLRRRIKSSSLVLASIFLCIHLIDPFESTLATTASYLLPNGIWAAYIIRRFLCVKYVRNVRVLEGGSLVVPALDPRKARIIQPSDILHTRLHHIGNQQILRIDISRSTPLFFRSEEFEHSGELEEIARLLTPRARAKPQIKQPLLTLFVSIGLILLSLIHWTCFDTGASQLIRLGALIREPLIVSELYRLLTYSLIHLNLTHLLLNVALFLGCGYAIEHTMPAPKFAALLIASISVSASAFWWSDHMLLIGFSGAVWGCAGYFVALRCDPSHDQLERFPQLPTWTLILAIGAEMGLDALTQHTSLGVHALGFLVGCAFYVLSKKLSTNTLVHAGYALALTFFGQHGVRRLASSNLGRSQDARYRAFLDRQFDRRAIPEDRSMDDCNNG